MQYFTNTFIRFIAVKFENDSVNKFQKETFLKAQCLLEGHLSTVHVLLVGKPSDSFS